MINNNALTPGQPPRQHWRRSSYSGTSTGMTLVVSSAPAKKHRAAT
jgi:hypothetical protein